MITWIVGLSGAGKSTIGRALYDLLGEERPNLVFLDGDEVRRVFGDDLGYTLDDRRANAERFCRLTKMLDEQDIHVICSILSVFEEHRRWCRENLEDYTEVYVRVPRDELIDRDPKGLYERFRSGETENVVGMDLPFEEPKAPDLVIDNTEPFTHPRELANRIAKRIRSTEGRR